MPRFFVASHQIENGFVTVLGDDAHHISRALRMAVGEHITVCDMQRNEYECELCEFLPDSVRARVLSCTPSQTEPPVEITLYQALPKGEKLDFIIQKAVECGATRIVPFESERCVVRCKKESEAHKTERRARIALEAAKQCGRGVIPTVLPTVSFLQMLEMAAGDGAVLFCYEGDGTKGLGEILREYGELPTSVSIVIGSEGGFSQNEVKKAKDEGAVLTGLGKRILRTETASGFVLSCLIYALEL